MNAEIMAIVTVGVALAGVIPVTKDHSLYQFMRDGDGDGRV